MEFYSHLVLYYFAVIVSVFLHRYFSKFIASDFQNNRSLKIKRRWGVAYFYGVGIWSIHVMHEMAKSDLGGWDNSTTIFTITGSIFLIFLWLCYIIVALESPKKSHKKRKWK